MLDGQPSCFLSKEELEDANINYHDHGENKSFEDEYYTIDSVDTHGSLYQLPSYPYC